MIDISTQYVFKNYNFENTSIKLLVTVDIQPEIAQHVAHQYLTKPQTFSSNSCGLQVPLLGRK